jgi:RHS repeat-associated protein
LSYDGAGNLTADKDGYEYQYDYENRIVKITKDGNDMAEFAYDALGTRIERFTNHDSQTTCYYYNDNWQVVTETDGNGLTQRWFVYGNYIDEPLMMVARCARKTAGKCLDVSDPSNWFAHTVYYVQDGLYSTRALVSTKGFCISEQTAYDVYGNPLTWTSGDADADRDIDAGDLAKLQLSMYKSECDPNYNWRCDIDSSGTVNFTDLGAFIPPRYSSTPANQQSFFTNPYYFTGRRVDLLDNGSLTLQYNRHRYYDYYTGRWTTHDPLGINPAGQLTGEVRARCQYKDSLSLYQYALSHPQRGLDAFGLTSSTCPRRVGDPEVEEELFRVWWKTEWEPFSWSPVDPWTRAPLFGWYHRYYRWVNYQVRGWDGITILIAAGGECSELVSLFWKSWVNPSHHEVVQKHQDCDGVWHSYGRPCKARFICKQKCCYGGKEWTADWPMKKLGVLDWGGGSGTPHCHVEDRDDAKKMCPDYWRACDSRRR